jgi:hypothetical protein
VLIFLGWLGYSIGMHAIPSRQDAASFTAQVKEARGRGVTLLLARGVSGLITLANACASSGSTRSTPSASAWRSRRFSARSEPGHSPAPW